MNREAGTVIKIRARGKVSDISKDTGKYTLEIEDFSDITEAEKVRIADSEAIDDDDLNFIFGEDE